MSKIIEFSERVKEVEKKATNCPNCIFAERHARFDFLICRQNNSPRLGEIVDKEMKCELFFRDFKNQ